MPPPSRDSIAKMKQKGYDPGTIQEEESRLEIFEKGLELCPVIEAAFADVTLGQGIGLLEAQALDDYADHATQAKYRAGDEMKDWRSISSESLRRCHSSLSFFDAQGMRFHLPAFLLCDLRGEYGYGLAFCLTRLDASSVEQFSLLDETQRAVVRQFLLHIRHDPNYRFYLRDIEKALDEHWR